MTNRIKRLEESIGYQFADPELLEIALTHASHGDGRRRTDSNERMEFLGDRVLGLLVAEQLYAMFEGLSEGGLAHRLNALVKQGRVRPGCARSQSGRRAASVAGRGAPGWPREGIHSGRCLRGAYRCDLS